MLHKHVACIHGRNDTSVCDKKIYKKNSFTPEIELDCIKLNQTLKEII